MIAALYVQKDGAYSGTPGVDVWDEARDARLYAGPYPVVAHPPCQRWGKFATGAFRHAGKFLLGDDAGCFAAALASVRRWGGVLEHPMGSQAWKYFGLIEPPRGGGWVVADWEGGWTCCIDQGNYGHAAQKPTWLYANGVDLPSLHWGESTPRIPEHRSERWKARAAQDGICVLLSRKQRAATPPAFRDLLLSIAASARPMECAA